jgi:hypothetical protein
MPGDEAFYDNPEVQANYFAHRARPDNPNDALERPLFLELAGNLSNLDIVDLGCGNASFGKEALLQGARSYTGIEIFDLVTDAGFELERVRESRPQKDNFLSEEEYEGRLRIPLFLFIAARKTK